jgi:hypothetical protein
MDVAVHLESQKMEQAQRQKTAVVHLEDMNDTCEWTDAGTEPRVPDVAWEKKVHVRDGRRISVV